MWVNIIVIGVSVCLQHGCFGSAHLWQCFRCRGGLCLDLSGVLCQRRETFIARYAQSSHFPLPTSHIPGYKSKVRVKLVLRCVFVALIVYSNMTVVVSPSALILTRSVRLAQVTKTKRLECCALAGVFAVIGWLGGGRGTLWWDVACFEVDLFFI